MRTNKGFTIVELLIVVVIIAILATITIISYNGIQARALDAKRATAASSAYKALSNYFTLTGSHIKDNYCLGEAKDYPADGIFTAGSCTVSTHLTTGAAYSRLTVNSSVNNTLKTAITSIPDGSYPTVNYQTSTRNEYARGVVVYIDAGDPDHELNIYIYSNTSNFTCPSGGIKESYGPSAHVCRIKLYRS